MRCHRRLRPAALLERAARGRAPPGAFRAAVVRVAVGAAAAADFPGRVTHLLLHADPRGSFCYKYRTTDFDDDPNWGSAEGRDEDGEGVDEHGERWGEYMTDCPTPHCAWVADTHMGALWAPRRQRRALRALLALLRVAGSGCAWACLGAPVPVPVRLPGLAWACLGLPGHVPGLPGRLPGLPAK
jgi:hypothetical protein